MCFKVMGDRQKVKTNKNNDKIKRKHPFEAVYM